MINQARMSKSRLFASSCGKGLKHKGLDMHELSGTGLFVFFTCVLGEYNSRSD